MGGGQGRLRGNEHALIFALLTLLTYITLYFFRHLDDNRLTSWQSAFFFADAAKVFLIIAAAVAAAFLLSRASFPERHPLLFLFAASYIFAVFFWKSPEVIVDASRYFTQAKHLEVYGIGYFFGEWGRGIAAWTDMPAVPFLYGLIFRFFGENRMYIQAFTTLLFSLTVVLTYLTGKALWDEYTGFLGGLLLLGVPYLYSQVPLMLVDVPSMFFLMLAVYMFLLALRKGGVICPLSAFSLFVAFFTKYSTWLMLTVVPVLFAVMLYRNRRQGLEQYALRGMIVFFLAFFMISLAVAVKHDVIIKQIHLLLSYQRPGLGRWGESFVSTFFFQIHPCITAAAFYSLFRAFRKRDPAYLIIVWLPLLVVLMQIKRVRYIIMVFPMLSLMAAYGLMQIRDWKVIKNIGLCVAVYSVVIGIFVYLPLLNKISLVNLKDAGEFLDSIRASEVEVFTLSSGEPPANPAVAVPILDLFTEGQVRYDYKADRVPYPNERLTSPLRFSWEYRNPTYYGEGKPDLKEKAAVVITVGPGRELPEYIELRTRNYSHFRTFNTSENIFDYQTFVTVYY